VSVRSRRWTPPAGHMTHAEYLATPQWRRRNVLHRAEHPHCEAGIPGWRRLFPTSTHHERYRCGHCGAYWPHFTGLADHWAKTACGLVPPEKRFGLERPDDLRSLCEFHHKLFEFLFRRHMAQERSAWRKLPRDARADATERFIRRWKLAYASALATALGAFFLR
jgi:hypothetical protein